MRKKILIYFLLCVIVLIGAWLRIAGIITNSFSFTYDVGRDMIQVAKIVNDHNLTLIGPTTGLAGLFYGPWWYYILILPFYVSGGNPQAIAFFMSLIGIFTIFFMYVLGKKVAGNSLALMLAFFTSFSPSLIGVSNQIWNPNLIPLFVVLVLLLVNKIFLEKNYFSYYPLFLGFLLGLIMDLEVVFGVLFTIGVFLSLLILAFKKVNFKKILFMTMGFLIALLPRLLFELRHDFVMSKTIINSVAKTGSASSFSFNLNVLEAFKNLFNSTFPSQAVILKLVILGLITIVVLKFVKKIDEKIKFNLKLSSLILLTFLAGLTFFPGAIWSHYIIGIPVLFILIISLFILALINYFKIYHPILFFIFAFIFLYALVDFKFLDSFKASWEGNAAVYRNQIAVIDYIYKNSKGKNFNYVAYTPPIYDYTYQYLFSWYGKKKYGYTPSLSKQENFFLILEPDYDHPLFLEKWLEVRKNDGKLIREEVVKGEIKVQKRIH